MVFAFHYFLHHLEKFNREHVRPVSCFAYHENCYLKLRAEICLLKATMQQRCVCGWHEYYPSRATSLGLLVLPT